MKKTMEGFLFNRLEKMGGEDYNHIGFEDKDKSFGDVLASAVPEIGMRRKARITIETIGAAEKNSKKKKTKGK